MFDLSILATLIYIASTFVALGVLARLGEPVAPRIMWALLVAGALVWPLLVGLTLCIIATWNCVRLGMWLGRYVEKAIEYSVN